MKRATICVVGDDPFEVEELAAWLSKWRDSLTYISPNEGCGCCIVMHRIEGPADAIAELPPEITADNPAWNSGL